METSTWTDEQLIERLTREDEQALSLLYERWSSILMSIGLRFSSSKQEVEDVLHDVFLEIWKTCKDFDPDRGSARTWIVMKMRCRMLDLVRKKSRHAHLKPKVEEHMTPQQTAPSPDKSYANTQLRQVVQTLPERLRQVLILTYFEHLPAHEAAIKLDIPVGTVKSRLASAKLALKDALTHTPPLPEEGGAES